MTSADLEAMRALVRAKSGLASSPVKPAVAPWSASGRLAATPPAASPEPRAVEPTPAPAPSCTPAATNIAATPNGDEASIEGDAWRPDAAAHRLVELLMAMRALSCHAPPRASRLDADARSAAA